MVLSFKGSYAGASVSFQFLNCCSFFCLRNRTLQLFLAKERNAGVSTYWRLSPAPPAQQQVVKNTPILTTESVQQGAVRTTMITTTSVTTTTRTVTRIVVGDV